MPTTIVAALAVVRARAQAIANIWEEGARHPLRAVNVDELARAEYALADALGELASVMKAEGLPHADAIAAHANEVDTKPALRLVDEVFPRSRA